MELTVREAAEILNVPEHKIYHWIGTSELPAQKVKDQYYFNRSELLEWATMRSIPVTPVLFREADGARYTEISFTQALEAGGLHYDIPGSDRPTVLREMVTRLPLDGMDRETLLAMLSARETGGSTAIGNGVAIPHSRQPILAANGAGPSIATFFLKQPIPYGASDGQPVHVLFYAVAPTVHAHLQLLARIAFALHDEGFRTAVVKHAPAAEILAEARRVEATFDPRAG